MPQILKPLDVAKRLKGGETRESIFFDGNGGVKAKLIGPRAEVRDAGDDNGRTIDFVISSEAIDRYDSTLALGGWKLSNYRRNPVVLWGHDDFTPPIGRGSNVRYEGNALCSTAEFAPAEIFPLADTIYQLLKAKFLNAASVGFIPLDYEWSNDEARPYGIDFKEQELLEWSVVSIPANPECLVQARSAGINCSPIIGWAERALDREGMTMVPRAELEALRKAAGAPAIGGSRAAGRIDWDKIKLLPEQIGEAVSRVFSATEIFGGEIRAGKVLSAANAEKLQTAHDHIKTAGENCAAAVEHVRAVLDANTADSDDDDDENDNNDGDGNTQDPEQASAAAEAVRQTELQRQRATALKLRGQPAV